MLSPSPPASATASVWGTTPLPRSSPAPAAPSCSSEPHKYRVYFTSVITRLPNFRGRMRQTSAHAAASHHHADSHPLSHLHGAHHRKRGTAGVVRPNGGG